MTILSDMSLSFRHRRGSLTMRLVLLCSALLLAGCAVPGGREAHANFYDLGPLPAAVSGPAAARPPIAVSVAEVVPAAWLDSPLMFYRLLYANPQQPRAYAQQRWLMQPAALFGQRLKARIAQSGGVAASAVDGPTNLAQLRIEADDFSQVFEAPEKSHGSIALRASLYQGRTLLAQKSFSVRVPATSNDAAGGARALAAASDAAIADLMSWLAGQPLKR